MMPKSLYSVAVLKDRTKLKDIVHDFSGCYKWWAPEKQFQELCAKLDVKPFNIINDVEIQNNLFCIYVGQTKRPLYKRINNHLHSSIRYSTLRRTICALFGEKNVDSFLDKLFLEFVFANEPNKEKRNKKIDEKEDELINQNLRILNIKDNRYCSESMFEIKNKLVEKRKTIFKK